MLRRSFSPLLVIVLLLAACSSPTESPSTDPEATPTPSETPSPTPTASATPTSTPTPGASSTPTSTPTPTATSTSTPTPTPTATPTPTPSSVKKITAFNIQSPSATGSITESTHKVSVSVLNNTNLTSLVPLITIQGASVSPASGVAKDFSNSVLVPLVYTVTAADGSTQAYDVTVTTPNGATKSITAFSFPSLSSAYNTGTINQTNHTISFTMPFGTPVTSLAPSITKSGSSVSPASGAAQDFSSPVIYTVKALDQTTLAYTVSIALPHWITTAAGDGTTATLNGPQSVVKDSSGNLYVADRFNHRVRRIDPSGTATTFAGTGVAGFSGDNGPAASAQLEQPISLAIDTNGNIYIADRENNRIRKVAIDGTITTVVGTGTSDYSGDGGSPTAAGVWLPDAVAVDGSGNLYIATSNNDVVRKVSGGVITTLAGTGDGGYTGDGGPATSATLNTPLGLAVDGNGNVYIAEYNNHVVRKVSTSGTISTVAGTGSQGQLGPDGDGGPATSAHLDSPIGLAFDADGLLTISQENYPAIRRIAANGTISTIVGTMINGYQGDNGPASQARLKTPRGLFWDSTGALYIADYGNNRVRRVY